MELKELKRLIQTNLTPKFMIYNTTEPVLTRQYIEHISKMLNKHYRFFESIDEVLYETSVNIREDFIYVVLNDEKPLKNETYIDKIKQTGRYIILYYTELKDEYVAKYDQYVVNFNKLDKYTILAYVMNLLKKNNIAVDQEKVLQLIEYCNESYSLTLNEIDKIIALNHASSNTVTDYMLENGFSDYRKTNVFKVIQKIIQNDKTVYNDLIKLDENIIGLFTIMYRQIKNRVAKKDDIRLITIMQLIIELDTKIKNGEISDKYALDYLLYRVM